MYDMVGSIMSHSTVMTSCGDDHPGLPAMDMAQYIMSNPDTEVSQAFLNSIRFMTA
jgi:hypothetical protein